MPVTTKIAVTFAASRTVVSRGRNVFRWVFCVLFIVTSSLWIVVGNSNDKPRLESPTGGSADGHGATGTDHTSSGSNSETEPQRNAIQALQSWEQTREERRHRPSRTADEVGHRLIELTRRIDESARREKLDLDSLLEGALEQSREEFLARVPLALRTDLDEFLQVLDVARHLQLERDGKGARFFEKRPKPQLSADHQTQEARIQRHSLRPEAQSFVADYGGRSSVDDESLTLLVAVCERSRACVEKSLYLLLHSGLRLTEKQYQSMEAAL